jgi:hypothetical protein
MATDNLKLTARPWNMHEPNISSWWLVPSTEWPVCKYNKLYFGWNGQDELLVGFHVEKGLGPSVKAAYPKAKGYFVEDDWQWLRFVRALEDQTFRSELVEAAASVSSPLVLRISGFYVQDPSGYDPYSPLRKPDVFTFEWDRDSSTFLRKKVDLHVHAMTHLDIASMSDLVREIKRLSADPWLWIDVHVDLPFKLQTDAAHSDSSWGAEKMWMDFLRLFRGTLLLV